MTEETEGTDADRLDQLASYLSGGGEGRGGGMVAILLVV